MHVATCCTSPLGLDFIFQLLRRRQDLSGLLLNRLRLLPEGGHDHLEEEVRNLGLSCERKEV